MWSQNCKTILAVRRMREIYKYLNSSTKTLPGIGEKLYEALERLNCSTAFSLLTHFPTRISFRSICNDLSKLPLKSEVILELKFLEIFAPKKNKVKKVVCDKNGVPVELLYFNYFPYYLFNNKKYGDDIVVLGNVRTSPSNGIQIAHPTVYNSLDDIEKKALIYPLTYAINSSVIHKFVNIVLKNVSTFLIPEWLGEDKRHSYGFGSFLESLQSIHNPKSNNDILPNSIFRRRLAFDELLASQIAISIVRKNRTYNQGNSSDFSGKLKKELLNKLQFTLTEGQVSSLEEIEADQRSSNRMVRLLQGDVGSGKTLVALCAILNAIEGIGQAALMAPTDILANQHFNWISESLEGFGIKVALLTGKIGGKKRQLILGDLRNGEIQILIGTHAIFQDSVEFQNLRLVIIDEQHRFGVQQRMALMNKGKNTDVVVMSATPIPRTLSMTMYGDMDVSILSGKPKGRMPVITYSLQESKVDKVLSFIRKKISLGEKIYWVCPLIEGDIENDNIAVENRFVFLKKFFGEKVGLMHGKLPSDEKDKTMNDFAFGEVSILVSTTVVEVGVDVPDATLLIIESPDRFGLAQLHQLRGRVGRSMKQSECIMLYSPDNLTHSSVSKIKIMKDSNDGFYIAEQDLKLRGGGSVLGSKQSGLPGFKIADLEFHSDLLSDANKYANEILMSIGSEDTQNKIELLLNIFGYKENFKLISAG